MSASDRVQVPGSERQLDPDHPRVGEIDPQAEVEVTVYVRPRAPVDWVDREAERHPDQRRRLERDQWAEAHGAHPDDLDAVRRFAGEAGLTVTDVDVARRAVGLRGTVDRLAGAFEAQLAGMYQPAGRGAASYRGRTGPLTVPSELGDVVLGVFGLDDRPQARPHIVFAAAGGTSYTPIEVGDAYDFPAGASGAGETVAILELGGGFTTSDLSTYFGGLGMTAPRVTAVGVDGAANLPGQDTGADGEVMLDIEVIGALVPDASIIVYFAPNTDQGFLDGLSTAVHDSTHKPSVVSISWGQSEDNWSAQSRAQMEQILTEAGGLGVTVTAASGDGGSADGATDGRQHADFPASAPHALACGGTSLQLSAGQIAGEAVWNDSGGGATGGGVSRQFPLPSYQAGAAVPGNADTKSPGRGVPDVCGDADPATGYRIRAGGTDQTVGGTSAVAPLWAALITRLNQSLGAPVGFVAPRLYPLLGSAAFHDITSGNNGAYSAGPGWDACTGLGSPHGAALLSGLRGG
jgi:kumamolisin